MKSHGVFILKKLSKMKEIDLNNPIFALYVDVENLAKQEEEKILNSIYHRFKEYSNITVWIFPSNENRIECIYNGRNDNRNEKISKLLKEIDLKSEILLNSKTKEEFQANMRNIRINGILEID
jgi:hypothetical protein